MERNKLKKLVLFILCVFILALIYTFFDSHANYDSSYTLGWSMGRNTRHIIKIFATLTLILLAFRNFKARKSDKRNS